ncbi:helix-turn-helix domain-containing protein [Rhodococcoides kyotonense]|uniref:Transcriptional regulator, contains XRE-family HTH domain n=1 Tax=Rhodococcoides kyotonense TaxID=398843 RepID=A0A239NDD8_9NOCA|nr:helix-turn-helix transcriptional regulator [Rhodococcus kyotonensis]SNT52278.1 Transcriptional regulator, contains XRE-family HTH domain [Rhodococcus kyotonensis]
MADATVIPLRTGAKTPEPLVRDGMGRVLRRIRQDQKRTLDDVASEARVSMPYLSEIERGRKEASSEVLSALCGALDIRPSQLLMLTGRELAGASPIRRVSRGPAPVTMMAA